MDNEIGRRLREIRSWRQLSIRTVAELSGLSYGYLAKIERGDKPVNNRRVLEALADTLRVSPTDLTGAPYAPSDPVSSEALASLEEIEAVLTEWIPGEIPDDGPARPWPQVTADSEHLTTVLRPQSDYAGQGRLLPTLTRDLLVHAHGEHRGEALPQLMAAYYAAGNVAARLGKRGLTYLAAERVREAAELLDEPEWLAVAAWVRAQFLSSTSRSRQYRLAVASADYPGARLESRGMSHLTAAMAAAAQGDGQTAKTHLDDAARMAAKVNPAPSWGMGTLNFTAANVGIWRVAIGTELGDGGRVAEIARKVEWYTTPVSRQGAFWLDLGRGLLQDRNRREQGLHALLRAESLTPQQVRVNPFVREAVADLLRRARRDAGGRELRGLAWRMGVAPSG